MAYGSDIDFYGNYSSTGGISGYLSNLLQPWQQSSGYLGTSSYVPSASTLPATATGFLQSYIPELSGLQGLNQQISPEVQDLFKEFRFGGQAFAPGAAQEFANTLLQREDVQELLQRSQYQGEAAYLTGGGGTSLQQIISQQFDTEGSMLQKLYGSTGFGKGQILTDVQRFIAGQESGLGNVSSDIMFGARGQHTEGSRTAVLAQLFGSDSGLINLGGGRSFNPYSMDVMSDIYRLDVSGGLTGHNVLNLGGGILSTQDAGITKAVAEALSQAEGAGFGGRRGYRFQSALGELAGVLDEGEEFQQLDPNMRSVIDQWYQGLAGSGWGRGLNPWFMGEAGSQGLV